MLHMSFASCAHAIMGRVKSKGRMFKHPEVHVSHSAIVTWLIVKLSASAWIASILNSGGSCAH